MPAGDGTGPWGLGPMTGRAMGLCAGYPAPGYANPIPGRGFGFGRGFGLGRGRGFGRGRGWGRGFYGYGLPYAPYAYPGYAPHYSQPTAYGSPSYPYYPQPTAQYGAPTNPYYSQPTSEQELQMLKDDSAALKSEMEAIEARMSELKKQEQSKK